MNNTTSIAALETFYEHECEKPIYVRLVDEEGYIVKSCKGVDLYRNYWVLLNALHSGKQGDIDNESYVFAQAHNITVEGIVAWYKAKYGLGVTSGKKWANARNTYHT